MTPAMKKLIINADDLGFSRDVNRAILDCVHFGTVTAASLMVNMPFAGEAVDLVRKQCPDLSLALHFTLTSGKPVAPPEEIPLLVDDRGFFKHGFAGLWKNLVSSRKKPAFLRQAGTEFQAQFHRMKQFSQTHGLHFDHLDSHQHVHVLPGLLEMFQQTAEEHGLVLRIPRESFCSAGRVVRRFHTWLPGGISKHLVLNGNTARVRQQIGYFGILETGTIDKTAIREMLRAIRSNDFPWDVFELNTHPSTLVETPCAEARLFASPGDLAFHRSLWRRKEYRTLIDPDLFSLLARYGVQLTGFDAAVTA